MNNKWIFLTGVIILSLKLLIIDTDPPKWDISFYQPVDEPYYTYLAYNYFETETFFANDISAATGSPLLTNLITYFSLETFGDNYLGLRFSSLFFSVMAYVFFFLLLQRIVKSSLLQLGAVLFFTLNFTFTTANLIVEPTIARMMAAILVLWLVVRWEERPGDESWNMIWKSALVSILFLISYPTNVFLIGAAYISLIIIENPFNLKLSPGIRFKRISIKSFYFAIGVLIAIWLYYVLIHFIGGNLIEDIFLATSTFGGRVAIDFTGILMNWVKLVAGNFFRFNPLFLFLSVLAVLFITIISKRELDKTVKMTIIFIVCFLFQTAFLNDFPQRKLLMLLPFLILLASYGFETLWKEILMIKISQLSWLIFLSIVPVLLLIYLERKFFNSQFIPLVVTGLGFSLLLLFFLKKISRKLISYSLFILLLLPEIFLFSKHYLEKRTYHYKNTYKSLSQYNDKNFIGGYSMGFRVNNKIVPHYNTYFYNKELNKFWYKIDSLSNNGVRDYSIGYATEEEKFKKVGFEPKLVLMPSNETVSCIDWILYEEVEIK